MERLRVGQEKAEEELCGLREEAEAAAQREQATRVGGCMHVRLYMHACVEVVYTVIPI